MTEVEVRFEREKLEGIVPIGTYLVDAAKRFGVRFEDVCLPAAGIHFCKVKLTSGAQLLTDETKAELDYFAEHGRHKGERLACQARIDSAGEVVIMTEKKASANGEGESSAEDKSEQYKKEFAELPLEKKIANLVQLESIALGETVSFIINSPFKVGEKLMEVMAEFGFRKEEHEKDAVRPEEHKAKEDKTKKHKPEKHKAEAADASATNGSQ